MQTAVNIPDRMHTYIHLNEQAKQETRITSGFLLTLFFDPKVGGDIFFGKFS
jgi:hypothetical protein